MKKVKFFNRKTVMVSVLMMMLMMVTAVVYALTPIVDGDDTGDWGTNPTTCTIGVSGCARIIDDPLDVTENGSSVSVPEYDVRQVFLTNDGVDLFVRLDFESNGDVTRNTWRETSSNRPILNICFDIDNNTSTGGDRIAGNCDGDETITGIDYYVQIIGDDGNGDGLPNFDRMRVWDGSSFVNVATPSISIGYNEDADGITEISIGLADLGYDLTNHLCSVSDSGTQPCNMAVAIFYDNGAGPDDDDIPDTGAAGPFPVGSGSPLAVSLQNVSANSTSTLPVVGFIAFALMAIIGTGVALTRRQRA